MPNRDEILRDKTYKEDGVDVGRRVFYTLTDNKGMQGHRTTKVLALLVERLHAAGMLDETTLDDLLFECLQ